MPLQNLLVIHSIGVLKMSIVRGAAMTAQRSYNTVTRTLQCRVEPLQANQRDLFQKQGYIVSHKIRFLKNPQLANGDRVMWRGTVLRIVPGIDPHGLDTMFVVFANKFSEDNPEVAIP
jgi:hypothetical protein